MVSKFLSRHCTVVLMGCDLGQWQRHASFEAVIAGTIFWSGAECWSAHWSAGLQLFITFHWNVSQVWNCLDSWRVAQFPSNSAIEIQSFQSFQSSSSHHPVDWWSDGPTAPGSRDVQRADGTRRPFDNSAMAKATTGHNLTLVGRWVCWSNCYMYTNVRTYTDLVCPGKQQGHCLKRLVSRHGSGQWRPRRCFAAVPGVTGAAGRMGCIKMHWIKYVKLYPVSYHQHQCHSFSI